MSSREKLRAKAIEILSDSPKGVRYSDLMKRIQDEFSNIPYNTITGSLWNLDTVRPAFVYKPGRGIFRHVNFKETELKEGIPQLPETPTSPKEVDFYLPFAEWIKNELEECTKAIPLGGNKFKDKWGTPDVIGLRASRQSDIIKIPTEIVCAEIKIDSQSLITAFGQACSYKLFSHKSYLVIPAESSEGDIARLDALCRIFGIGLILFSATKPDKPDFQIRVRAARDEPDMFYVNKNMKTIEDELFS